MLFFSWSNHYLELSIHVCVYAQCYLPQGSSENPQHQQKCLAYSHNYKQVLHASSIPENTMSTLHIIIILVLINYLFYCSVYITIFIIIPIL